MTMKKNTNGLAWFYRIDYRIGIALLFSTNFSCALENLTGEDPSISMRFKPAHLFASRLNFSHNLVLTQFRYSGEITAVLS